MKNYNIVTTQQESKIGLYEQAITLLNQGQNNAGETERLKQELQQRYLTEQERQDIRQRDQREVQQQQQANQYQQAVNQFTARNGTNEGLNCRMMNGKNNIKHV